MALPATCFFDCSQKMAFLKLVTKNQKIMLSYFFFLSLVFFLDTDLEKNKEIYQTIFKYIKFSHSHPISC